LLDSFLTHRYQLRNNKSYAAWECEWQGELSLEGSLQAALQREARLTTSADARTEEDLTETPEAQPSARYADAQPRRPEIGIPTVSVFDICEDSPCPFTPEDDGESSDLSDAPELPNATVEITTKQRPLAQRGLKAAAAKLDRQAEEEDWAKGGIGEQTDPGC
jgi:hypothetical protein